MLSRRAVLLAQAAWMLPPSGALGQQPKVLRVGYAGIQPPDAANYRAFVDRMGELGYLRGKNFAFEYVQAAGLGGYDVAYRELATRKIDIFLAAGSEPALRAARAVAGAAPIALLAIDFDPLAKGYVDSLTRPGHNITGILARQIELAPKRIELLREALPGAHLVGLLYDTASRDQVASAVDAARNLGFETVQIEVTGSPPDYAAALRAMAASPGAPIALPASPLFVRDRAIIAATLLERRIPSICAFSENVEAGALMSYGIDLKGLFADIADYVGRIAHGQNPATMPIEQSTRFHMAVNLKTMAALNIALPAAFTARANEVFE